MRYAIINKITGELLAYFKPSNLDLEKIKKAEKDESEVIHFFLSKI